MLSNAPVYIGFGQITLKEVCMDPLLLLVTGMELYSLPPLRYSFRSACVRFFVQQLPFYARILITNNR